MPERLARATGGTNGRPLISSNQKQRAGCFGACLCSWALIGLFCLIFAVTYLTQPQIDHGREPKVERYNRAVAEWRAPAGGEAELNASAFSALSHVDGSLLPMAAVAQAVPLDDRGDDLPELPAAPSHVAAAGRLLLNRRWADPSSGSAHTSELNVTARYGAARTSFLLRFPTFGPQQQWRGSRSACDAAFGQWSGRAASPLEGDCTSRTAVAAVCAVVSRGVGGWRLAHQPGEAPGCGLEYTPAPADRSHNFASLGVTLHHAASPYIAAAELVADAPPPWDFGPRRYNPFSALNLLAPFSRTSTSSSVCVCAARCTRRRTLPTRR